MSIPHVFRCCVLCCLFLLTQGAALGAQDSTSSPPRVLLCSWVTDHGQIDLDYLGRLRSRGILVDYLDRRDDLTWERLKGYNAIILYDIPSKGQANYRPGGGPASGPGYTETMALVERYRAAGGGVFLLIAYPIQYFHSSDYYFAAQEALGQWGAQLPMEDVIAPPVFRRGHPRLLNKPFFYTENIAPSPVSEGVERLWFPAHDIVNASWFASGPLAVDDTWTVVVRGPAGSRTKPREPKDELAQSLWPRWAKALRRPEGVPEPPLFAIRDRGPGRLALLWCWPQFHIGAGSKWNYDGVMFDKGLDGLPSNFDRLLENTLRWLAAPSLAGSALGGADIPAERLVPFTRRSEFRARYEVYPRNVLPQGRWQEHGTRLFRGMVGPRTVRSGGQGDVADYARVAREQGLDFIVFLEDLAGLTAAELEDLTAACRKHSGDDLLLLPGFRARSNLGNQVFGAGPVLTYPPPHLLGGTDGTTYLVQAVNAKGEPVPGNQSLAYQLGFIDTATFGFFDFQAAKAVGGMDVPHLRCFSMCGVRYYDHGRLVEDVTPAYLKTSQGCMSGTPVSINLVDSPAAMVAEIKAGHSLTYAAAPGIDKLWDKALRWNTQFMGPNVFASDGPLIHVWPGNCNSKTYAAEDFVVACNAMPARLHVTAAAGLKEVALYDGARRIARYLPGGTNEVNLTVYLDAVLQQNISVVATDMAGGTATSFPARHMKWGLGSSYCSDHVNAGNMFFARGMVWQRMDRVPEVANEGFTWDGGPPSAAPLLSLGTHQPDVTTDRGRQDARLMQIPLLRFCDERVHRGSSVADFVVPESLRIGNAWTGYGPMQPPEICTASSTYTEFTQYPRDVDELGGNVTCLYEQELRFAAPQMVKKINLATGRRQAGGAPAMFLTGHRDRLHGARDIEARRFAGSKTWRIGREDWFAAVSREPGNAMLFINRGDEPWRVSISDDGVRLDADLPPGGRAVTTGEVYRTELQTIAWPMDRLIADSDDLLRDIRYLLEPAGMSLQRGTRLDAPMGLIELAVDKGAVELVLPRPDKRFDFNLPLRVHGLNRDWSCLLWQKDGYAGKYHGAGRNRVRPLGVDEEGRAYCPAFVGQAETTHWVIGHPVIADTDEVAIRVVCLEDTTEGKRFRWHVTVHNPTAEARRVTLTPAMALPGLFTEPRTVVVAAGSDLVVQDDAALETKKAARLGNAKNK